MYGYKYVDDPRSAADNISRGKNIQGCSRYVCVYVCVRGFAPVVLYKYTAHIFSPAVAGVELASIAIKCLSHTHTHTHINSTLHLDHIINITHIPTELLSGDYGSGCCVH